MSSYKPPSQSALRSSGLQQIRKIDSFKEPELKTQTRQIENGKPDRLDRFPKDYGFPFAEGGAAKLPMVNVPFNESLLTDYCMMLTPDNNRDINIFAI